MKTGAIFFFRRRNRAVLSFVALAVVWALFFAVALSVYQTAQKMLKDLETRCVELQNRQIDKSSWVGWARDREQEGR